jgi:glycosyltransferase involved in cell wall biosynthesis
MTSVFLNGRFRGQAVTGVQRFSAEIAGAIDRLIANGEWPETTMLTPRSPAKAGRRPVAAYSRIALREVGRRRGHVWEQTDLPAAARGGALVNLGNTAPLLAGRRQVVVIHDAGVFDTPESYSFSFRLWYKSLQHALVRAGAQIVTVSEFSRGRIATRLGLDPARVAVMGEGSDHILRVPGDPGALERFGLRAGQYALVVGSRVAHKNFAALQEVSAEFARRGMVVAVAGGSNRQVFKDFSEIGFAGYQLGRPTDGELRTLYENAVCLLFPSRYEGFGLPPVEAMACGCPVLAGQGGAVEEICGDSALYFDADDRLTIVEAVRRLLDEDGLATQLSVGGRARAMAMTWDASARVLAGIVERAC